MLFFVSPDWWKLPFYIGIAALAIIRTHLEHHNLYDPYTPAEYDQLYASHPIVCGPETRGARTLDGTCNNLEDPLMGSLNYRFGRNARLDVSKQDTDNLLNPNPRLISQRLLKRPQNGFQQADTLNMLITTWVQYQVHDWLSHGDNDWSAPYEIPVPKGDVLEGKNKTLLSSRTAADPSNPNAVKKGRYVTHQNTLTHWWDMSQLYGTNKDINHRVRTMKDGKLQLAENGLIPFDDKTNIEITGFNRNWWTGMSMMHNLFTLEHNYVCDLLKAAHPDWSDQKLFDKARLAITAVNAKVHTVEWTPALLQQEMLQTGMRLNWYGVPSKLFKLLVPGNPFHMKGEVGHSPEFYNVPFSLTEEFTSVYRLHSLMPDDIRILDSKSGKPTGRKYATRELTYRHHRKVVTETSMADLFRTFGHSKAGALVLHNYPHALTQLEIPGQPHILDLAMTDILRDRERGVPRYNEFRRQIALREAKTFTDINPDPKIAAELRDIYQEDIEKVDLLVGCLAEVDRPKGYAFGQTPFQIFLLMASRRLATDRFLTDDFHPEMYSQEGFDYVSNTTFKDILIRHYPQLKAPLDTVDNPFKPWLIK